MMMPGRSVANGSGYRYGFNGKENERDISSLTTYDYGFRIYSPAIAKFLSVDPLTSSYPELTPYQFSGNSPITFIDLDGLEMAYINPVTHEVKGAGPLYLPTASKNDNGWILFSPPVHKPAANSPAATSAPNVHKPALQHGSDHFAGVKAVQSQQIALKKATTEFNPEPIVLKPDIFGNGHIGPQSVVDRQINAVRAEYYSAVGDNIRSGLGGAVGYLVGGDRGSFIGAVFDNVAFSFAGIPGNSSVLSRPINVAPLSFTQTTEEAIPSPARQLLARALRIQGINSAPGNFKQKWSEGGYDYEVRIHGADPNAPSGSNSATATTFRVARRMQGTDSKGQGYGWEYADDKGNWYKTSALKANTNTQAANDTHIPVTLGTN